MNIAFLLAGSEIRIPEYIAFTLIIYATYTLDRAPDCREDAINRSDLSGADGNTGVLACALAFTAGTIIMVQDGIFLAPFFPLIVGYVYTRGVRVGSFYVRLKGGAGMKNLIFGITWGGTIARIVSRWCSHAATILAIFNFYAIELFITSCVNDFKEVPGDLAAGYNARMPSRYFWVPRKSPCTGGGLSIRTERYGGHGRSARRSRAVLSPERQEPGIVVQNAGKVEF